jgi:hypothetical protein
MGCEVCWWVVWVGEATDEPARVAVAAVAAALKGAWVVKFVGGLFGWGEATDEPAREDARPTEIANRHTA